MKIKAARAIVEELRRDTSLYLPRISDRRGFSSSRVEHLLNRLVRAMPSHETYFEVGSLEGLTLEAAATLNSDKRIVACDPGTKYDSQVVSGLDKNVTFHSAPWEEVYYLIDQRIGCAFYDADHSIKATSDFLHEIRNVLADEAVIVFDDWDRESVRDGVYAIVEHDPRFQLIAEMPTYGDGLTCQPQHFGWYFGIGIFGWRRR